MKKVTTDNISIVAANTYSEIQRRWRLSPLSTSPFPSLVQSQDSLSSSSTASQRSAPSQGSPSDLLKMDWADVDNKKLSSNSTNLLSVSFLISFFFIIIIFLGYFLWSFMQWRTQNGSNPEETNCFFFFFFLGVFGYWETARKPKILFLFTLSETKKKKKERKSSWMLWMGLCKIWWISIFER